MKIKVKDNCPLNNFESCKQFECAWFTSVRGKNSNTGEEVDDYGCAIAWLPLLTINSAMQQSQTGSAIESFRNEMVKANEKSIKVLAQASKVKAIK